MEGLPSPPAVDNAENSCYNLRMAHNQTTESRKRTIDKRRAAIKAFLRHYKATHPCVRCGEADPVVLDFDHRDPKTKSFPFADAADRRRGREALLAEIAKCDILCANCHRKKTWLERIMADL